MSVDCHPEIFEPGIEPRPTIHRRRELEQTAKHVAVKARPYRFNIENAAELTSSRRELTASSASRLLRHQSSPPHRGNKVPQPARDIGCSMVLVEPNGKIDLQFGSGKQL